MKDLNGTEIDFANETLFPLEYMMPKRNRTSPEKIHISYEEKGEDQEAEDIAEFMHSLDNIDTID
jgi:hypothetical protein